MKPWHFHQSEIQENHRQSANRHDYSGRNGDDVPEPSSHKCILFSEDFLLFFRKFIGIFIVHKNSYEIKNSRKIAYHEDNMKRFYYSVKHSEKLMANIMLMTKISIRKQNKSCFYSVMFIILY